MDWTFTLTLAQADAQPVPAPAAGPGSTAVPGAPPGTTPAPGAAPQQSQGMGSFLFPVIIFLAFMWLLILMPQRKEKKRQEQLMASLKKGDKVTTIGGIIGTIVEVRDTEILVKVDEASNTRIHFRRNAIQSVGDEPPPKK
jgi:preprotein translocase subunit YajC